MKKQVKDLKFGDIFEHEGITYNVSGKLDDGTLLFLERIAKDPVFESDDSEVEVWEHQKEFAGPDDMIRVVSDGSSWNTKVIVGNQQVCNVSKITIEIEPNSPVKATLEILNFPIDVEAKLTGLEHVGTMMVPPEDLEDGKTN